MSNTYSKEERNEEIEILQWNCAPLDLSDSFSIQF